MADTQGLGPCGRKAVGVQVPPPAQNNHMKQFWQKYKKFILVAVGIVFIVAISWRLFRGKTEKYSLAKVRRGDLTQTVSASGKTKSQNQVDLKFQTSGLLTWVGVKEGDWVKKWQVIAQLDRRELQKTLDKYLRDYSEQRNDFEEMYRVTYQGAKPEDALTDTARRILEKNQWDLEKAVLDVELKDIALKLATLITPIEGIVTKIDTPVAGINITPATAVFTVADPNSVIFVVNVDEADIREVLGKQKVKITLDAFPGQEFEGEVTKISFASITTTGGGTAFPVEISLPENTNLMFKVGMNGDAEIITQKKEGVLLIPASAVWQREDKNYVWKVVGGKAKKQEVKIGSEAEDSVEILGGLIEGEMVISEKVSQIKEGQKIQ